eukprot:393125_1
MEVHVCVAWAKDAVKGHPEVGVTPSELAKELEDSQGAKDGVTICETAEMNPIQWVGLDALPLDKMWADDELWYPPFFAGKQFRMHLDFRGMDEMLSHKFEELGE